MEPYVLIIEDLSCWGCKACEVACKQENRAPDGVQLIRVTEDGPRMVGGKMDFVYRVVTCRHCEKPACVTACPEGAITKREDGIVVLDETSCIGCGICRDACPYGAISFDEEAGVAKKCNLCHHRVDQGLLPACADTICLGHCISFGLPDEIETRMKKKIFPAPI